MTYTPSSLLTPYVPPALGWEALLASHGATGRPEEIVADYGVWCQRYGIDANLALAQACHETGYFTSRRWREECNPAGLGVTSNNTPPNPFTSPDEGIRAHVEHLCCYVYTLSLCPCDHANLADRRHAFHAGKPAIADLITPDRKWAVPGTGYVESIVKIANAVTGGIPLADPFDRTHWSADTGPARALADVSWFVVHDTEGHFAGDESVLTSPAAPVESAHFILGRVPGQCVYSVPLTNTAWTAGNDELGALAVQVEMSKAPDESGYTDYQYTKLAEIYRWCVAQGMTGVPPVYLGLHPKDDNGGPLPDDPGIIGHAGVPNPAGLSASPPWGGFAGHTDPGPDFDWPRFIGLLSGAPSPPAADKRTFPETGRSISGPIKGAWERFGTDARGIATSMEVFGLPLSDVRIEGGLPTQYFERQVLEDHGAKGVMGRRLGADAARAAGLSGPGI